MAGSGSARVGKQHTQGGRSFGHFLAGMLAIALFGSTAARAAIPPNPVIRVVPNPMTTVTLYTNQTTTSALTIYNDGGSTLTINSIWDKMASSPTLTATKAGRAAQAVWPKAGEIPAGAEYVPGELLIKYKPTLAMAARLLDTQLGTQAVRTFQDIGVQHVKLAPGVSVAEAVRRYTDSGLVEYAEPNYIRHLQRTPNDPRFNELWGMHNTGQTGGTADADIDAPEAWDTATGGPGVLVGLIDTGIDYTHPDLAANVWTNPGEIPGNGIDDDGNGYIDDIHGWDFINGDNDPMDDHGHGSHTAGTIGAVGNNGIGVAGVCWNVKIMALKVFNASGSTNDAALLNALLYANRMRAKLTSNSWGGGPASNSFRDAVYAAGHYGALFVASSGNDGSSIPSYPAAYECDNIISVAATDHNDALASFSNWGATWVDLAAPGVNILSCAPGGGYQLMNGTSMACPHVSGAAALLWSYATAATSSAIKAAILNSAQPLGSLTGKCLTGGRLRLPEALQQVRQYAGASWLWVDPLQVLPLQIPSLGSAMVVVYYDARVPEGVPGGGIFRTEIHIESNAPTTETVVRADMIVLAVPELEWAGQRFDDDALPPSNGDGDGYAEPGETVELWVDLANRGYAPARGVAGDFTFISGTSVTLLTSHLTWPDIPSSATRRSNQALVLQLAGNCPLGSPIVLQGVVDENDPAAGPWNVRLTTVTVALMWEARGTVTDFNTGLPIGGATVTASGRAQLNGRAGEIKAVAETVPSRVPPGSGGLPAGPPEAAVKTEEAGGPGLLGHGGPDGFGYGWVDSDDPGRPIYSWVDITGTGTQLPISGDDNNFGPYNLGFSFPFYGGSYSQFWLSCNGFIAFTPISGLNFTNRQLPSTQATSLTIAALWDDLFLDTTSTVYSWSDGSTFILSFIKARHFSPVTDRFTFQIILRSDGTIILQYQTLTPPNTDCTVGIQNATRTTGLNVVWNAAYVHDNLAVRIALMDPLQKSALTGPDGTYRIGGLPTGSYALTAAKAGYAGCAPTTRTVPVPPDTSGLDFRLTAPRTSVSPTSLTLTARQGETATGTLWLYNTGSAPLNWTVLEALGSGGTTGLARRVRTAATLPQPAIRGRGPSLGANPLASAEIAPAPGRTTAAPQAFSDILFNYDIQTGSGDNQGLGVEFDGTYFYITGGNSAADPNKVHVFNASGGYVRSFDQTGTVDWGWRDLAYDGQYLYGSDDGNVTKFQTDGIVIGDFPGPGLNPCRGLAYDPATDHFWSANWASNIYEFTRTGAVVHSFPNALSIYGLAWDSRSPNGPWLWAFSQDGPDPLTLISQFNPRTGVYTGVSFLGWGAAGDMAGGLCFTDRWNPSYGVLVGLTQGSPVDRIVGYEICIADVVRWLKEQPTSGTVSAGSSTSVTITGNATDLAVGPHRASVLFEANDPVTPVTTVPVTLLVTPGDPELGVQPRAVDYGIVWRGQQATRYVTVTNIGYGTLDITGLPVVGVDYHVTSPTLPIHLDFHQSARVAVEFAPHAPGPALGTLTVQSNGHTTASIQVALWGQGINPPVIRLAPSPITTVTLLTNQTTTRALTIYNDGDATLTVTAVSDEEAGRRLMARPAAEEHAPPRPKAGEIPAGAEYVPGEVLVKYKTQAAVASVQALEGQLGAQVAKNFARVGVKLVKLGPGVSAADALQRYVASGLVEYAEPNYIRHLNRTPNDPRFNELWGMHNTGQSGGTVDADIDAPEGWDVATGGPGVVVGLIDTGIDYNHPDLAANIWTNPGEIAGNGIDDDGNGYIDDVHGWDFINGDNDPMDDHEHGSHTAGTIGAVGDNGVGVVGVCWNVKIMALKVFNASGNTTDAALLEALLYANLMEAKLTSNSWGGGPASSSFQEAIYEASHYGALFVTSSGNSGSSTPQYPAAYECDNIISVAATDRNDALASFSNWGATWVDLAAPGVAILSCAPGGGYQLMDGTSMACPHVAGACALLWSYGTDATSGAVKAAILDTAQPLASLAGKCLTGGRLRLPQALQQVQIYAGASWISQGAAVPLRIPGHGSVEVTVGYDARVPTAIPGPGTFYGRVLVDSDDPVTTRATVNTSMVVIPVPELHLAGQIVNDDNTPPSQGDNDGYAEPGETVEVWIDVANLGFAPAITVTSTFTLVAGTSVTLLNHHPTWPNLAAGQTRRSSSAVSLRIAPNCPVGTPIVLQGVVDEANPLAGPWTIDLTTITVVRVSSIRGVVRDANTNLGLAGVEVNADGEIQLTGGVTAVKAKAESTLSAVAPGNGRLLTGPAEPKGTDAGGPGLRGAGGPDGGGYTWEDSDEPGGPAYAWVDITGTGTALPVTGDDATFGPYNVGFNFPFYAANYTQFWVSTNGWISFIAPTSSDLSNDPLPSTGGPAALVAALWDDLVVDTTSTVHSWSDGSTLILSFSKVRHYSPSTQRFTFQIILSNNGKITVQYQTLTTPNTDCTVGIQNADKTIGLTVVYNAAYLHDALAVEFSRNLPVHGSAVTGPTGAYAIHGLQATSYTVIAEQGAYSAVIPASRIVTLPPDAANVDFSLTSPRREVGPTSFTFQLPPGAQGQKTLRIGNTGTADFNWRLREVTAVGPLQRRPLGRPQAAPVAGLKVAPFNEGRAADRAPSPGRVARAPQAFSDILFNYDVQTGAGDNQCLGVEFDGTNFYVTGGNNATDPNKVHVFDAAGTYLRSFDQNTTDWGWRDLAYDGQYLYGSDDANITQFQGDGTILGDFPGPGLNPCRGLAYDPATDHFWTANYSSNIIEFDRTGATINAYANTLQVYGLAWDSVSPDGPWLWVFSQDGSPATLISQFDPRSGTYTGVSFVGWGAAGDVAGGLCFTDQWNSSYGVLVGLTQGAPTDQLVGYELCDADALPWLSESPTSGTVASLGETFLTLTADATSAPIGTYYGYLMVRGNDPLVPETTATVTLQVLDDTAPTTPGVPVADRAPYTSRTTVVYHWAPASDPETGIEHYWIQAGTTPGGSNLLNVIRGNVTSATVTGANGQTLYCRVKAINGHGLQGPWSRSSAGTRIDTVPPAGPGAPGDGGIYTSLTTVTFRWNAATDAGGVGVRSYDLRAGTWPGAANLYAGNVGAALTRTVTGANGQTLYGRVRAQDRAGNLGAWSASSDGIRIDTVAPGRPGTPQDAGVFTSSTAVRFAWTAAVDGGTSPSGVGNYQLQVGTALGTNNVADRLLGTGTTAIITGVHGQTLYARVRALDRAKNPSAWSNNSNGITIDTAAPRLTGATPNNSWAVKVRFDEPVLNAGQKANYQCTCGVQVMGVQPLNNVEYLLHTTTQAPGVNHTITVSGAVTDRAGNPVHPSYRSQTFRGPAKTAVRSWELYR